MDELKSEDIKIVDLFNKDEQLDIKYKERMALLSKMDLYWLEFEAMMHILMSSATTDDDLRERHLQISKNFIDKEIEYLSLKTWARSTELDANKIHKWKRSGWFSLDFYKDCYEQAKKCKEGSIDDNMIKIVRAPL